MEVEWVCFDDESPIPGDGFVSEAYLRSTRVCLGGFFLTMISNRFVPGLWSDTHTASITHHCNLSFGDFWLKGLDPNAPCQDDHELSGMIDLRRREIEV